MLANDERLVEVAVTADLFGNDETIAAFGRVNEMLDGLPAGQPPDLGSAIGNEESTEAAVLRALALDGAPLPDPA